jgi:hypothetical protein
MQLAAVVAVVAPERHSGFFLEADKREYRTYQEALPENPLAEGLLFFLGEKLKSGEVERKF